MAWVYGGGLFEPLGKSWPNKKNTSFDRISSNDDRPICGQKKFVNVWSANMLIKNCTSWWEQRSKPLWHSILLVGDKGFLEWFIIISIYNWVVSSPIYTANNQGPLVAAWTLSQHLWPGASNRCSCGMWSSQVRTLRLGAIRGWAVGSE